MAHGRRAEMANILLVEDDRQQRRLLEHLLKSMGHQVTAVDGVATATSVLGSRPYDLLFCDVVLWDGSGLTVAGTAAAAGVRVLLVTGQGLSLPPGSLDRYDYLLKPVRAGELVGAIKRCLDKKVGDPEVVPRQKPVNQPCD
jgi:DNA-binding NtrC family response regulator